MSRVAWLLVAWSLVAVGQTLPFSDGFEGASPWGGTLTVGSNTAGVTTSEQAWDGAKALRVSYAGAPSFGDAYLFRSLVPAVTASQLFARVWLQVPKVSAQALAAGTRMKLLSVSGSAGAVIELTVVGDGGGQLHLEAAFPAHAATLGSATLTTIGPDTWNFVELGYDEALGQASMWINDPQIGTSATLTALASPSVNSFKVGLLGAAGSAAFVANFDDAMLSTERAGSIDATNLHAAEFEYGGVLVTEFPPGKHGQQVTGGAVTLAVSSSGHRGLKGLVVNDADGTTSLNQSGAVLGRVVATATTFFQRLWWKPGATTGARTVMGFYSDSAVIAGRGSPSLGMTGVSPIATVGLDASGALVLTASSNGGADGTATHPLPTNAGGWHLLELYVTPSGGTGAAARAYVDGQDVGALTGLDWTGRPVNVFGFGELDGDPQYQGADLFDDVRESHAFQPSALRLVTGALNANSCTAFTVQAEASNGGAVPVPEPAPISLTASWGANGGFFSDPNCQTPVTGLGLGPGANTATVYAKTSATGTVNFTVSSPDYLTTTASTTVLPAGTPPSPTGLSVTPNPCGTSSATFTWALSPDVTVTSWDVTITSPTGTASTATVTAPSYTFDPVEGTSQLSVIAVSATGRSVPASIPLLTDETPPEVPAAPTVTWNPGTAATATLRWSAPNDPGGSGVVSYYLEVKRPDGSYANRPVAATAIPSATVAIDQPGTWSFRVSASDAAGNSSAFSAAIAVPLPPVTSTLELTAAGSTTVQVGQPISFKVTARDSLGGVDTSYAGTVRFDVASGGNASVLPPDYTFTAGDQGQHAFADALVFDQTGTFSFRVTDGANSGLTAQLTFTIVAGAPPQIVSVANGHGAVGVPYRYSVSGAVEATGSPPLSFASCADGVPGFTVDSNSGRVSWTPTAPGLYSLCVSASNDAGSDSSSFTVEVAATAVAVSASFVANPWNGIAPLQVSFDATSSQTSGTVLAYRWDFGDGTVEQTSGPTIQHRYLLVGSYGVHLTLFDAQGTVASGAGIVSAVDGPYPPGALIVASPSAGPGPLTTTLSCDCTQGEGNIVAYEWTLDDGRSASGETITATFPPGRYHVRLMVVDANGLTAMDTVELVVTGDGGKVPPECTASVSPSAGPAPLAVSHDGTFAPGSSAIASSHWELESGGFDQASVQHSYTTPGWRLAHFGVQDQNGLRCTQSQPIAVLDATGAVPPVIVSAPNTTASCAVRYVYSGAATEAPVVVGEGPWTFEAVEKPNGFEIDATTGKISWTPAPWDTAPDGGPLHVALKVTTPSGVATQSYDVQLTCPSPPSYETCGCSSGGAALSFAGLALVALRRRRRVPGV